MERVEVAFQRKELERRLKAHDAAREIILAEMTALTKLCDHANAYAYSSQGDRGHHCPDCGWDQ